MYKKVLFFTIPVAIVAFLVYIASSVSFLSINIPVDTTSVLVENLKSGTIDKIVDFNSQSIEKRVEKGDYKITILSNSGSSVNLANLSGFFSSTEVNPEIISEQDRYFIGQEPNECGVLLNDRLVSYGCSGPVSTIKTHIPSSSRVPTYVKKIKTSEINATIQGVVKLNDSSALVLIRRPFSENNIEASLIFYTLSLEADSPVLNFLYKAEFLNPQNNYRFYQSLGNYIVNSTDNSEAYIGQSIEQLELFSEFNNTNGLNIVGIENGENSRIIHFEKIKPNIEDRDKKDEFAKIILTSNDGTSATQDFSENSFKQVSFCGQSFLCTLDYDSIFQVYNFNFEEQFKLNNINSFSFKDNILLLEDSVGIINYDLATRSGFYIYSSDIYKVISLLSWENDKITYSIRDDSGTYALTFDLAQKVIIPIDEKISTLKNLEYVDSVSAYKGSIFISPKLGELIYDESTESLDYSPIVKANAKVSIETSISELGISDFYEVVINGL